MHRLEYGLEPEDVQRHSVPEQGHMLASRS